MAAADAAAAYLDGRRKPPGAIPVLPGAGVAFVLPQRISLDGSAMRREIAISTRLEGFYRFPQIEIRSGSKRLGTKRRLKATPVKTIRIRIPLVGLDPAEPVVARLALHLG